MYMFVMVSGTKWLNFLYGSCRGRERGGGGGGVTCSEAIEPMREHEKERGYKCFIGPVLRLNEENVCIHLISRILRMV